jgi:hypothetical protein
MVDTPTGSVHRKKQSVFGRLKTVLRGRSKENEKVLTPSRPSSSELTASAAAKTGPVDPKTDDSKSNNYDAKDYWQMAYEEVIKSDQNILTTLLPSTATEPQDAGRARTKEILDDVVKATEMQYRENQRKNYMRGTAHKIINAALSFQDIVSNVVKFDPTGYASSAWAIVSLGLTVWRFHQASH